MIGLNTSGLFKEVILSLTPYLRATRFYLTAFLLLATSPNIALAEPNDYLVQEEPAWLLLAASIEDEKHPVLHLNDRQNHSTRSWAVAFDNDILVPGHRDQDYTYGINFTQTGENAREASFSLVRPLETLDNWIGFKRSDISIQNTYSRELGLFGFTPENITQSEANPDDRPYASLIYISSSHEQVDLVNNLAWKSTLTIGLLGTGLVGELQNITHQSTSSKEAKGWNNQISEGGELTGRYLIARQRYFEGSSDNLEIKSTVSASVGYLTEASWSLSMRAGQIHSPWSSFNPELASYGEKSSYSSDAKSINEQYFWAGLAIKGRVYNAFLQGQFRDSAVSYDPNELRPLLVEAWMGYTFAFKKGYRISYVLRGHSSEVEQGAGDRNLVWGGVIIAYSI
jgi:hypothetical protein